MNKQLTSVNNLHFSECQPKPQILCDRSALLVTRNLSNEYCIPGSHSELYMKLTKRDKKQVSSKLRKIILHSYSSQLKVSAWILETSSRGSAPPPGRFGSDEKHYRASSFVLSIQSFVFWSSAGVLGEVSMCRHFLSTRCYGWYTGSWKKLLKSFYPSMFIIYSF